MKKVIIIVLIVLVITIWVLSNFQVFTWLKVDSANVLISSLAFCGLMIGLFFQQNELELQREELQLQRNELKDTRKEFELQNRTLKLQRFDDTFFNLLSVYIESKNSIKFEKASIPINKIVNIEPLKFEKIDNLDLSYVQGEDFFKKANRLLYIFEDTNLSDMSIYDPIFSGVYAFVINETSSYFRITTIIFKTINNSDLKESEKEYYFNLFSDFISINEFRWLYYFSLFDYLDVNPLRKVFSENKFLRDKVNIGNIYYEHLFKA